MIDQKSKNQEHIVFNNSEISYEEYIEDIEEVEKERAKSFDAPRRVLSLVEKWREWQVISMYYVSRSATIVIDHADIYGIAT